MGRRTTLPRKQNTSYPVLDVEVEVEVDRGSRGEVEERKERELVNLSDRPSVDS